MRHRRRALMAAAAACLPAAAAVANTQVTWTPATSGTWSDAAHWSGGKVPNNGTPANTYYDAYLNLTGSPYTVTLGSSVAVARLVHASPATLNFAGGALSLSDPAATPNVALLNSTTFTGNGTVTFDGPRAGAITFVGGQSGFLTLAPGITVRTGTQSGTMDRVVNQGTIAALTAGTSITLNNWSNTAGTLQAANGGALNLSGTFTRAALGSFSATSGGAVRVYDGTLNNAGGTLTLSPATGSLTLSALSTLSGGTVASTGGVPLLVAGAAGAGDPFGPPTGPATLSGVTVSADLSVAYASTLVLSNNTVLLGQHTTLSGGGLALSGAQTLANTEVLFAAPPAGTGSVKSSVANTGATTTVAPSATVRTDGGSGAVGYAATPLLNQGTISAQTAGTSVTVTGSSVTNAGSITATNGGALILAGSNWTNTGTISAGAGSAVTVTGAVTPAFLSTLNTSAGSLVLASTLDLTGTGLDLAPNLGNLTLGPAATLKGGTLTGSAAAKLLVTSSSATTAPTLDGVTLAADAAVSAGVSVTVKNGLTLANGARLSLAGATLAGPSSGTGTPAQTIGGSGEITFDGPNASTIAPYISPLTLGPGVTVRTNGGSGTVTLAANQGTLSAETPGQTLTAYLGSPASPNTGTLRATNNSTLVLAGTFTTAALGTRSTATGGTVSVAGALDNTGSTLTLSANAGLGLTTGGKVTGGTVTTADDTPLVVRGGTLASVDLDVPVSVNGPLAASDVTIRRSLTSATSAGNVTLSGAWTNPGSIALSGGAQLTLNSIPADLGPISVTNGAVNLNTTLTTAQFNAIVRNNAPATLTGTIDNSGSALSLPAGTSPLKLTAAATLRGGTLDAAAPVQPQLSTGSTLDSVTVQGTLTVPNGIVPTLKGALALAPGSSISINPAGGTTGLRFSGATSLTGTGTISFDGTASSAAFTYRSANGAGDSLNLGPGITVRTGSQGGTLVAYQVDGTLSAETPGKTLSVDLSILNGTAQAINGATLQFQHVLSNNNSNTLTGGTWIVGNNSTLALAGNAVVTNAASVTLSGPASSFPLFDPLTSNAGSLTLAAGRTFTTRGDLSNSGTLTVGPSSALKVKGTLTNTGTLDLAGGALVVDYTGPSPADAIRQQIAATHLTSSTASADPAHPLAVAYVEAKDLLRLTGTQTAAWSGVTADATSLLVTLTLPGDANIDGKVNADDYALLDRASARSLANAHWTDGDFNYDGQITSADYLLIDTTYAQTHPPSPDFLSLRESQFGAAYVSQLLTSIPEPSSLFAACGLALPPLLPRRRTKS